MSDQSERIGQSNLSYSIIDLLKFYFAIIIVAMHSGLFSSMTVKQYYWISKIVFYPAVPFFFISSGFFLGTSIEKRGLNNAISRYVLRLLPILIIFECISIGIQILSAIYSGNQAGLFLKTLKQIVFYPPGGMWFIQGCIIGSLLILFVEKLRIPTGIKFVFFLLLYIVGLVLYSYCFILSDSNMHTLIHNIWSFIINERNGLFFAAPLLYMGILLYKSKIANNVSIKNLTLVLLIILTLWISELWLLFVFSEHVDDIIITLPVLALTIFIYAVKISSSFTNLNTKRFRELSVGIFVLHAPLITIFRKAISIIFSLENNLLVFCVVIICSVIICDLAYRFFPRIGRILR